MTPTSEDPEARQCKRGDSAGMQVFDFFRKCVRNYIAAWKFRKVDPEVVTQTFWAGIHGVASLLIMHHADLPHREAEKLISSTVHKLGGCPAFS